jgi:hypothetical protein
MIYESLFSVNSSRLAPERDDLRLDFSHLFQFFPYAFHLLLLPGLDHFHFLLGIIELDVGVYVQGDADVAVAHQVLQGLGAQYGFPMVISWYLLVSMDKKLEDLTQSIERLRMAVKME